MKKMNLAGLACLSGLLLASPMGAQNEAKDGAQKIQELEGKLSSSGEQLDALKKQVAELNGQLDRMMKQMAALENLVQSAVTDEAKAKAETELKGRVLSLLDNLESDTPDGDLWTLYWQFPATPWSDDLLWALGLRYRDKSNDPKAALYAWQELESSHPQLKLEDESLAKPLLADVNKNRQACVAKGVKPEASDRACLSLDLARLRLKAGDVESAKALLQKALAGLPADANVPIVAEIKALNQQSGRLQK